MKEPLGRPMRKWKDNIRIDITEGGWEVVNWMRMTSGQALMNTIMKLRVS